MSVKIAANKKRVPVVGIIACILSIFFFITLLNISNDGDNKLYLYYIYVSLFVWSLYYTLITSFDYLRAVFSSKAVLLITDEGIEDNLSIFSCGYVSWSQVNTVEVQNIFNTNFLVIKVNDPEELIRHYNRWKQRTLLSFQKKFGSPIVISQKRVQQSVENLRNIIAEHRVISRQV